jgi:8-oxo-dGTP pyrophosphatase MutT (NUDIX family)
MLIARFVSNTFDMEMFLKNLGDLLQQELPGQAAHDKMRVLSSKNFKMKEKPDAGTRIGAVLLLLFPHEEKIYFPLILRPPYEGVRSHGGQIAFPGGKREIQDADLCETALRETYEEIGVRVPKENVLGQLSEIFIPPSNICVTPFVGYVTKKPAYYPALSEVAEIYETHLHDIMRSDLRKTTQKEFSGMGIWEIPYFDLHQQIVWGATAAILSEFADICEEAWKS